VESFSLYQRTLDLAGRILGDARLLARRLQVPGEQLEAWLQGRQPVPKWAFLVGVDIVADADYVIQVPEDPSRRSSAPTRSPSSAESQETLSAQPPLRKASA
jgi:hypothetical protein